MKALIIKDLAITRNQTKLILLLAIICVFMAFVNETAFTIGYMGLLLALLALGTISYDDYDHGYSFLFSLPITKTTYVIEKYLFCLASSFVGVLIGVIATSVANLINGTGLDISGTLSDGIIMILLSMIMVSIMIPLRIKYGTENGKIVSGIILGALFAGILLFRDRLLLLLIRVDKISEGLTPTILILLFALITIIAISISFFISIKVINNKEF